MDIFHSWMFWMFWEFQNPTLSGPKRLTWTFLIDNNYENFYYFTRIYLFSVFKYPFFFFFFFQPTFSFYSASQKSQNSVVAARSWKHNYCTFVNTEIYCYNIEITPDFTIHKLHWRKCAYQFLFFWKTKILQ